MGLSPQSFFSTLSGGNGFFFGDKGAEENSFFVDSNGGSPSVFHLRDSGKLAGMFSVLSNVGVALWKDWRTALPIRRLSFSPSPKRVLNRDKASKADVFVVDGYLSTPKASLCFTDPNVAASIVFSLSSHVSHVVNVENIPQIFPAIIKPVMVYMINALAFIGIGNVTVHKKGIRPPVFVANPTPGVSCSASSVHDGVPFMVKNFGIFVINCCEKAARKWNLFHTETLQTTTLVCKENF